MRAVRVRTQAAIVVAAAAAALAVLRPVLSMRGQRSALQTPEKRPAGQSSQVFTPAHSTALEALRDFFNRRSEAVQPIAYTHKVHLANGMQCVNCHTGVDTGPDARIPGVKFCMMCHQVVAADRPEIKKLAAYYQRGEDVPWRRVYNYSHEVHVKFNHAPHVRAGVACQKCHGDMTQQTVAVRKVDLIMRFCVDCHKQKKASIDCTTCHF
jgi:hypothetical protein